jgi:ACT domain-containing protein
MFRLLAMKRRILRDQSQVLHAMAARYKRSVLKIKQSFTITHKRQAQIIWNFKSISQSPTRELIQGRVHVVIE